jgi:phosphoglycerate dehydrogenase-like enzyme
VTITPHVAAMTFPEDVVGTFADNLERHLTGQPLRFQLDWEQGY